jgi:fructoselysine 6-kinase
MNKRSSLRFFDSAIIRQFVMEVKTMIVGIGDNCIDYYLPPIDLKFTGGNVVNVVANLEKHGQKAVYIGTVGNDERGDTIISTLRDHGINTDYIAQVDGETGLTEIALENGDYVIKYEHYGVSNSYYLTDEMFDFLRQKAKLIHLSLTGKAVELIKNLKDLNIPLSCDISHFYSEHDQDFWKQLLPYLDFVFISAGSVQTEESIYEMINEIASFGPRYVVSTRGSKGCIAYNDGEFFANESVISTYKVVDPLGAGDAFLSGFLYSVVNPSNTLKDHVQQGSQWAAEACSHYGAW